MDEQVKPTFVRRIFRFIRRFFFLIPIVVLLVLLALAFEVGRWSVYGAHPELSQTEQANTVLAKVGKLIQLPNEQPTMAAINDAANAKKGQPFLTGAANGDILIVYPNAAEALLYRPSTNQLIAVGPVDSGDAQQHTTVQASPVLTGTTSDATTTSKTKK